MLRLIEIIREKGITNVTLARMLDVTPQYVGEVVNGHKNITIDTAKRFADVLGVPMAALFDGYDVSQDTDTFNCPYCGKPIKVGKPHEIAPKTYGV